MSKLYVTVYRQSATDAGNNSLGAPQMPPLAEWSLDVGFDSVQSPPFPEYAQFVAVKAGTNCALAFGEDPVADPEYHPLDAGERAWYGVYAGHKLAVIAA